MKRIAFAALAMVAISLPAQAELIERACNGSDRDASSPELCGCIQDVADLTLTPREQRRAAGFFEDPHEAQVVRQSSNRSDEQFWERYKSFGETAEAYCTF